MRLIALLPATWTVELVECAEETATLALSLGEESPGAVDVAVDEALAAPAMRGWVRAGTAAGFPQA